MGEYKPTKKSTKSLVSVIFVMLVLLELCSATMLFSRIMSFVGTKQRHYIALDSETEGTKFWTEQKELEKSNDLLLAAENHEKPEFIKTAFIKGNEVTDFAYLFTVGSGDGKVQHGFESEDQDGIVWKTETDVTLFKAEYENGEGKITVLADETLGGKSKIVAPGTSNSYTFTLKNTGKCTLDYTVTVEAFVEGTDNLIPIEAKLKNYEGKYIFGGPDEWVDIYDIKGATDNGYISADKIADYTIEWQWPFERGDDAYDTMLGDTALEHEMTVTFLISTYAECNQDHDTPGGEDDPASPATGDDLWVWVGILVFAIVVMIFVVLIDKKRREEEDEEQNDGKIAG